MIRKRKIESTIVGCGKNEDEKLAIRDAISYIPMDSFVNSNDIVVITANMVNKNPPEQGSVVGQQSLREVIKLFKEKKPKRIIVAAGSGGVNTSTVLKKTGYEQIINEEKVEFIDLNFGPFVDINLKGNLIKSTKINEIINEATIIVSFTQLKTHEEATMSACIKNIALSWPPAEIHGYPKKNLGIHDDLHDFIISMAREIPIDLSILSLSPIMIGTGPSKGIAKNTNYVLASMDAVAIDTIGARVMGYRPQAINYLFRCAKEELGQSIIENIDLKGVKLVELEKEVSKIAYGQEFSIDE
ncbi:DUF362 domain-containing protein [Clostridium sp. DL1XJH146]